MEVAKLILEYLKAVLVWPVSVGIILIVFLLKFRAGIEDLLKRMQEGEGYGIRLKATAPAEQQKLATEVKPLLPLDEAERFAMEHPKEAVQEYRRLTDNFLWEKSFNLIYGTQMDLLSALEKKGSVGEKYVDLTVYHQEFIKRSQVTGLQFTQYVGFLKQVGFVEISGDANDAVVKITPNGINFLSYVRSQYPYHVKPF